MTTELVNNYTPTQKQLGVAAVNRYGASMAERMLAEVWPNAPARSTLLRWRDEHGVVPTDENEAFWEEHEKRARQSLHARTSMLIPRVSDVIERLTDPAIALDDIPANKLQHATIAYGILHDKLVPVARAGSPLIGNAENVTLNVVAPDATTPHAEERPRARIIDVESRDVR